MKWIKEIIRQRKRGNYKIFTLREKLSFAYVFFGLSAFSLVVYASTHGELDLAEYHGLKTDEDRVTTSALQLSKTLKMKNATIIRMDGFKEIERIKIEDGVPVEVIKTQDE